MPNITTNHAITYTNIDTLIAIGDVIDIFLIFPCSEHRSVFHAEMLFEAIYFFVFAIIVARSNQMKEHHWLSWCWLYLLLCSNLFLCQGKQHIWTRNTF